MKVSLITPSFNRADLIGETAKSIFAQTYKDWEWVIVDDGSTDGSWDIIQKFAESDQRVKIYKRDRDPKGATICRNIAVHKSTGDYLLFIDTDDIMASFCLEQRVKAMQDQPACDFIAFPMLVFKKKIDDTRLLWNVENDTDDILRLLYLDPICPGTGTLWKKDAFIRVGLWDEEVILWQDIELHFRALLNGLTYAKRMDLPPDIFVRSSDDSISRSDYHAPAKLEGRITVLQKCLQIASQKGKLDKYKVGFRNLAKEIYLGASINNSSTELIFFWKLVSEYYLFSLAEIRILKSYKLYHKLRLYKLPVIKKRMTAKMDALAPSPEKMILKVLYKNEILS